MVTPLLNANQRRRVATHVRLLLEDLAQIAAMPELARGGEPYGAIRDAVHKLGPAVGALRTELALPAYRPPSLRRRVMATAEVWAISMEDLKARNLRGYGDVHPDLAAVLNPRLDDIVARLQRLASLADRLPET
jgi:hypothetical protein